MKFSFTAPYVSYKSSSEKLLKYQIIVSCVIMSLILTNNLFYKALISLGEFRYWSLLGLKGLNAVTLPILFPSSRLVASENRYLNGNRDISVKTCVQFKKYIYRICFTVTTFHFHFCLAVFFKDTVSLETKVLKRWNGVRLKALEIDQCRRKPALWKSRQTCLLKTANSLIPMLSVTGTNSFHQLWAGALL